MKCSVLLPFMGLLSLAASQTASVCLATPNSPSVNDARNAVNDLRNNGRRVCAVPAGNLVRLTTSGGAAIGLNSTFTGGQYFIFCEKAADYAAGITETCNNKDRTEGYQEVNYVDILFCGPGPWYRGGCYPYSKMARRDAAGIDVNGVKLDKGGLQVNTNNQPSTLFISVFPKN